MEWNKLNSTQKHMALMYLYRTRTDLADIELYLETHRFREMKMVLTDIPEEIRSLEDQKIYQMAYAEIGRPLPRVN